MTAESMGMSPAAARPAIGVEMKKVTAVLPVRNCRSSLGRCLQALTGSECVPEIIVVDDGSEDGTLEMVRSMWPQVTLLALTAHTGYAHAVNAGLRLVRTEYAFLIRPDLQPGKKCLGRLIRAAEQIPDSLRFPLFFNGEKSSQKADKNKIFCAVPRFVQESGGDRKNLPAWGKRAPEETLAVPDGCALYRMDVLEEIGWMDERHYEGLEAFDLSLRAALYGYKTVYAEDAVIRKNPAEKASLSPSLFRLQLAAGNSIYVFYKNLPAPFRASLFPLFSRVRAWQRRAFREKMTAGQGKQAPRSARLQMMRQISKKADLSYRTACERGQTLCDLERERRAALDMGVPVYAENLSDASFLGMDEKAGRVYPLYLSEREFFLPGRVFLYLKISRLLLCEADRLTKILTASAF